MTVNYHSHHNDNNINISWLSDKELWIVKKIISTLEIKELDKELQTAYAIWTMRHGQTIKSDNEISSLPSSHILNQDPPKSTSVNLHACEYNEATSHIYQTILQITQLGYKKIKLYCPQDSNRNTQTVQLLQQYGEQLELEIIIDGWFNNIQKFAGRQKIDRDLIKSLLNQQYIDQEMYDSIMQEINSEKHILWGDKYLKDFLTKEQLDKLNTKNSGLYQTVITQKEEAYTSVIERAGDGFDQLADYIEDQWETDVYHLVVWYRTTIQASDKKFTEISPDSIDLNYSCDFAEMHIATLNHDWNVLKQHKELRLPNPATYESDITQLSQLEPKISLNNTIIHNQNLINQYLNGLQDCLAEHLKSKRTNLLLMYCKLGGVVRNLVLNNCIASIRSNNILKQWFDTFLHEYIDSLNYSNENEVKEIFEILYANQDINNQRLQMFSKMSHSSRIKLDVPLHDTKIHNLIWLYAQKESYLTGSNKHLLQIQPIDGGEMMNLEDIYVEQQFDNSQWTKSTTQIADQLISQPWSYLIHGAWWEGKSTTLKAIAKHLLTTHNPPPLVTWITLDTDLDELANSDLPQVWFIDSLDELGDKWSKLQDDIEQIISSNKHISCIAGTRNIWYDENQDHIFTTQTITEVQKNKYISSYLNDVFGSDDGKPRALMETTIEKLWLQHTSPLIISMITQIMDDDNLSIELENIQTKSDLYTILIKLLKKKKKLQMTKEEKYIYLSNQHKGEEFDSKRAYLTWKLQLNDSWHLINPDDSFRSDNDPDYVNSELNDSLFYSGLIYKDKEWKIRTLHQSIFDYCANQYLTQHPNFTQDIKNILWIDLGDIQESIWDDFEYQWWDIKSEQNKHYQEQLKKVTSSVIGSLLDGMYFNSPKEWDDLMNKVIWFLYSETNNRRGEPITHLFINSIKDSKNTNIKKGNIITKLEIVLNPELTPEDIKNYFGVMPIEYWQNMWIIDWKELKIKWKWIAACATMMWFQHENRKFYGESIEGKKSFISQLYHIDYQPRKELSSDDAKKLIKNIDNEQWLKMSSNKKESYVFKPLWVKLREIINKSWYLEQSLWENNDHKYRDQLKSKIIKNNNEFVKFITFCWKKIHKNIIEKYWISEPWSREEIIKNILEKWDKYRLGLNKEARKDNFNFWWKKAHAIYKKLWLEAEKSWTIHDSKPERQSFLKEVHRLAKELNLE